jgi:UDP-glucose 4-epimerase
VRYLITGGAGFIGSHVSQRLLQRGDDVVVLDNLSTGAAQNIAGFRSDEGFEFVHGSVLDQMLVEELVARVDVVVHLAAAVGVRLIVEQPLKSLITNIRGSENVLEAAWKRGVRTLVTSTSEIYGKNSSVPLSETDDRILGSPSIARWAYSTSKAVDEILGLAYHREKGLPTVIVRLFNTVGPRQTGRYGMVIPTLISQALDGEDLTVFGDGKQSRCFCYVDDTVDALIGLLDTPGTEGEIFNVGNPEEVTITELAERIITRTGSTSKVRFIPYEEAYEQGFEDMVRRVPGTAKIQKWIEWEPRFNLDQILDRMVAFIASAKEMGRA